MPPIETPRQRTEAWEVNRDGSSYTNILPPKCSGGQKPLTPAEYLKNVLANQDQLERLLETNPAEYRRLSEALSEPLAAHQPTTEQLSDEGPF